MLLSNLSYKHNTVILNDMYSNSNVNCSHPECINIYKVILHATISSNHYLLKSNMHEKLY